MSHHEVRRWRRLSASDLQRVRATLDAIGAVCQGVAEALAADDHADALPAPRLDPERMAARELPIVVARLSLERRARRAGGDA